MHSPAAAAMSVGFPIRGWNRCKTEARLAPGFVRLPNEAEIYNAASAVLNVALGRIACDSFAMSGL
jgi:hypothetical protein